MERELQTNYVKMEDPEESNHSLIFQRVTNWFCNRCVFLSMAVLIIGISLTAVGGVFYSESRSVQHAAIMGVGIVIIIVPCCVFGARNIYTKMKLLRSGRTTTAFLNEVNKVEMPTELEMDNFHLPTGVVRLLNEH